MKSLVIIPTYNERENLEPLTQKVFGVGDYHVLIIDDNSPDGTGELADRLATEYPGRIFALHREGKLGLGTAYVKGFQWALEHGYDFVFEMDADFSHDPAYLPRLHSAATRAHFALGSRNIPGGGTRNWPIWRRMISRGGSLYARTILGIPVSDVTGGFKCFRKEALEALPLDSIKSNGYSFQIEVTYRLIQKGFVAAEEPIIFVERRAGASKMSSHIFFEALLVVWKLRLGSQFPRMLHRREEPVPR